MGEASVVHPGVEVHQGAVETLLLQAGHQPGELLDLERAVLRFTDEVVRDVKASDAAYEAVAAHLPPRELSELVLTIGFYMLVCRFLENFEVELEAPGQIDPTENMPPKTAG